VSDIFEIKGVNAVLRVGEKEYKFADPKFLQKAILRKKFSKLVGDRENMDYDVFEKKIHAVNKEQIKLYLPDLDDEYIESLGDFAFSALLKKILEITKDTFGAVVEKVEAK